MDGLGSQSLTPSSRPNSSNAGSNPCGRILHWAGSASDNSKDRNRILRLNGIHHTRGALEDWLVWRDAIRAWWVKASIVIVIGAAGVIAAIAAAVLAFLGWRFPISPK